MTLGPGRAVESGVGAHSRITTARRKGLASFLISYRKARDIRQIT
jgi:hypothetical protein